MNTEQMTNDDLINCVLAEEDSRFSYSELEELSDEMAHRLQAFHHSSAMGALLLEQQLIIDQAEIRKAHDTLDNIKTPTNGAEGHGKRQSLSLAQRINALNNRLRLAESALEAYSFYIQASDRQLKEAALTTKDCLAIAYEREEKWKKLRP